MQQTCIVTIAIQSQSFSPLQNQLLVPHGTRIQQSTQLQAPPKVASFSLLETLSFDFSYQLLVFCFYSRDHVNSPFRFFKRLLFFVCASRQQTFLDTIFKQPQKESCYTLYLLVVLLLCCLVITWYFLWSTFLQNVDLVIVK